MARSSTRRISARAASSSGVAGAWSAGKGEHLGDPRLAGKDRRVIQGSHVLPLPEPPERLVKDDAAEPGRQAGGFAELIDVREGKDIGFLNRILGIGRIAAGRLAPSGRGAGYDAASGCGKRRHHPAGAARQVRRRSMPYVDKSRSLGPCITPYLWVLMHERGRQVPEQRRYCFDRYRCRFLSADRIKRLPRP